MNTIENEYKFVNYFSDGREYYYKMLISFLDKNGIKYSVSEKNYTDSFYDTEDLEITKKECFLRKRDRGKCGALTVKKPVSSKGMLSRVEIEEPFDGICNKEMIEKFCKKNLGKMILSDNPILLMNTIRSTFKFVSNDKVKLTFDDCQYYDDPFKFNFLEIELEIVSNKEELEFDLVDIRQFITKELNFIPVTESKFSRGMKWKKSLPKHPSY